MILLTTPLMHAVIKLNKLTYVEIYTVDNGQLRLVIQRSFKRRIQSITSIRPFPSLPLDLLVITFVDSTCTLYRCGLIESDRGSSQSKRLVSVWKSSPKSELEEQQHEGDLPSNFVPHSSVHPSQQLLAVSVGRNLKIYELLFDKLQYHQDSMLLSGSVAANVFNFHLPCSHDEVLGMFPSWIFNCGKYITQFPSLQDMKFAEKPSPAIHILHRVRHTYRGDSASSAITSVSVRQYELDFTKLIATPSSSNSLCTDTSASFLVPVPHPTSGAITISNTEIIYHKYADLFIAIQLNWLANLISYYSFRTGAKKVIPCNFVGRVCWSRIDMESILLCDEIGTLKILTIEPDKRKQGELKLSLAHVDSCEVRRATCITHLLVRNLLTNYPL